MFKCYFDWHIFTIVTVFRLNSFCARQPTLMKSSIFHIIKPFLDWRVRWYYAVIFLICSLTSKENESKSLFQPSCLWVSHNSMLRYVILFRRIIAWGWAWQKQATVQATSVLTKASVWYEIRVFWANINHVKNHAIPLVFSLQTDMNQIFQMRYCTLL